MGTGTRGRVPGSGTTYTSTSTAPSQSSSANIATSTLPVDNPRASSITTSFSYVAGEIPMPRRGLALTSVNAVSG